MDVKGVVSQAVARCVAGHRVTVEEGPVGDSPYNPSRAEWERMRAAVPKRRREFYTGRRLATLACGRLGVDRPELPADEHGAPQWPDGVVGSITHCDTWAGAAVASDAVVATVGIDVEPAAPLPSDLQSIVASARELDQLAAQAHFVPANRVLFCVKEAVFKAWYPVTHTWLDFHDVQVELKDDGTWIARGGRDGICLDWAGGWAARSELVATALVVPVPSGILR